MRDRLIELILKSDILCHTCGENSSSYCAEAIADLILADGWMRPPCKVGDKVFRIVEMSTGVTEKYNLIVENGKVHGTITPCKPTIKRFVRCIEVTKNNFFDVCENFGKTVFLTKEEAEKSLRKEDEGK